ncbi:hypothetical protein QBC44DRAFT_321154 [Cladorrhinum sp. PSN332]|nr:hypothetical protein QBC44DRAFT_321154 [Cladorrhinum sp. PSN332]
MLWLNESGELSCWKVQLALLLFSRGGTGFDLTQEQFLAAVEFYVSDGYFFLAPFSPSNPSLSARRSKMSPR